MKVKSSEREARLAKALRENLKRRKSRDRAEVRREPSPKRPNKAQKTD